MAGSGESICNESRRKVNRGEETVVGYCEIPLWSVEDLVALWESEERKTERAA
jgi:hypothetical protein